MITNGIKAALTLALLALVAGGVALFYAHLTRSETEEWKEELRELDRLGDFADRIRDFEEELRDVAGDAGEFFELLDGLIGQTEDGFRQVAEQRRRMNQNLSDLAETVRALEERIAHLEETTPVALRELPVEPAPPPPSVSTETAETAEAEPEAGRRTHRIQSGDTLSGIAREYGVSLGALQEANPDVDPHRLRIGREIVIP